MARVTLSGKLTELVGTRHWGKKGQCMIQVSLEREPSGKTPIADRYYCCTQSRLRLSRISTTLSC